MPKPRNKGFGLSLSGQSDTCEEEGMFKIPVTYCMGCELFPQRLRTDINQSVREGPAAITVALMSTRERPPVEVELVVGHHCHKVGNRQSVSPISIRGK